MYSRIVIDTIFVGTTLSKKHCIWIFCVTSELDGYRYTDISERILLTEKSYCLNAGYHTNFVNLD